MYVLATNIDCIGNNAKYMFYISVQLQSQP